MDQTVHSPVAREGQRTIPEKARKALRVKPGDQLQYEVEEDRATIRAHPGIRPLKGALASKKRKGMYRSHPKSGMSHLILQYEESSRSPRRKQSPSPTRDSRWNFSLIA